MTFPWFRAIRYFMPTAAAEGRTVPASRLSSASTMIAVTSSPCPAGPVTIVLGFPVARRMVMMKGMATTQRPPSRDATIASRTLPFWRKL